MSQTTQGQAAAQRKWATTAQTTAKVNQAATKAVAPKLSINQPVGATKQNTPALKKVLITSNVETIIRSQTAPVAPR